MIQVRKITSPTKGDNRPIEEKLNEFFWAFDMKRDDIIHIAKRNTLDDDYITFYVFYDADLPETADY
ncbi:hypothetical protein FACS18949_04600 [Clostridia bacterium]|nr:hypothetical protein FACS189425_07410 [Clostridia bacterium]GHV32730.1 hypothetical protein FACS18949_04600 [Clostridia bacterium]